MHHCFDAPRRHRTTSTALVIALIAGLFALVAPTSPVAAGVASTPGAPTIVSVVPGDGRVTLTWSAPPDGGSPITGYAVAAYVNGTFSSGRPYFTADTTQVLDGLSNAVTYTFTVSARNAVGTGPDSEPSDPVTVGSVPGAPTGVTATGAAGGVVDISWTAPASDGGYPILGYEIVASRLGIPEETIVTTGSGTSAPVGDLISGRFYTFDVRARNVLGYGPAAAVPGSGSPSTSVPTEPTFVQATPGNRSVRVDWAPPELDGGSPILDYAIVLYDAATLQAISGAFGITGLTYTFGSGPLGVENGVRYLISVSAFNAVGMGVGGQVEATPVGPPDPPTSVNATAGSGQVTVSWQAPANTGGAPITGYRVTPFVGAAAQTPRTFTSTVTSQVITGLTNGTSYTFKVAAITDAGTGADSAASPAVTPGSAPGAPTGVAATGGNGRATVSWTAPSSTGGSPILGYRVTPFVGATAQPVQSFPSTATTQTVTGLTNGTAYTFRVKAFSAIGDGADSAPSASVTPAPAPVAPGAPTGVTATAHPDGSVALEWTPPTSTGGSPLTGFRITPYIGATAQTGVTLSSGTATGSFVTGLRRGTTYTFKVAAINAVGTGADSVASAPVTTPAAWAPHPSADSFTRAQFLAFAGRQPTAAELTSWRTALQNQTQTAAQLIETLFTATYWDGTLGPIVRLYRAVYLRDPDLGGLRYWEGQIRSRRQSLNQIANFFAVSPEFRTLYGNLGNQAFITKVYELVLERAPSASDLAYWSGELNRGQPRGRMVLLFSSSPEYKAKTANRVKAILVRYGLLDAAGPRATTDAATATITDQSGSPLRLITEVLASPQYAARL